MRSSRGGGVGFPPCATPGRAADPAPPAAPSAAYLKIVNDYMNCKSDEVEALQAELKKSNRELALKPAEEPDVNYVRQALAESRPAWWNVLKSGKKQPIHPAVFDRTLNATFDPTLKGGVSLTSVGGQQTLLVNWPADDLDNPAKQSTGFPRVNSRSWASGAAWPRRTSLSPPRWRPWRTKTPTPWRS